MIKKTINAFINSLLIIIFLFIFVYSNTVKETIVFGINTWLYSLFPSMFPILLISKIMIQYNLIETMTYLFGRIIEKLFRLNRKASFVIITSLFTGFPTGSIYTKELLLNKEISIEEANKLISISSFANPLFVISFIGDNLLNNKALGISIYIIHVLSGLLLGIINKPNNKSNNISKLNKSSDSFINILIHSINDSFKILINILGILLFFLIIISIINTFLPNNLISLAIKSLLELTTGVIYISKTKLNIRLKASLIGAILSFNGICIHFQIKSIIDNTHIKYSKYLYARIIHSILCFIIIYFLTYFF